MRYTSLLLIITYVDMTVAYGDKYPLKDSHLKTIKNRGYKLTNKVDGMLLFDGNKSRDYKKFVLVPETHPAFNGGMFMDLPEKITKSSPTGFKKITNKVKEVLADIMSRSFFKP